MISYIASIFASFVFIRLLDTIFTKKIKINKKLIKNILITTIVLLLIIPYYQNQNILKEFKNKSNITKTSIEEYSTDSRFVCNTLNYPALLLNTHLGFILFVFFSLTVFYLLSKLISKKVNYNELGIMNIIILNFLFYSYLIQIKNNEVTGIIIPLICILISGFIFRLNKFFRVLSIIIIVINLMIFVLPIQIDEKYNYVPLVSKTINKLECSNPYTQNFVNSRYYYFNKNIYVAREGLLNNNNPDRDIIKLYGDITSDLNKNVTTILDLSTYFQLNLGFYALIFNNSFEFNYIQCELAIDYYNLSNYTNVSLRDFDYVIISNTTYNKSIDECLLCFEETIIQTCDLLREKVISNSSFLKFKEYKKYSTRRHGKDNIWIYKNKNIINKKYKINKNFINNTFIQEIKENYFFLLYEKLINDPEIELNPLFNYLISNFSPNIDEKELNKLLFYFISEFVELNIPIEKAIEFFKSVLINNEIEIDAKYYLAKIYLRNNRNYETEKLFFKQNITYLNMLKLGFQKNNNDLICYNFLTSNDLMKDLFECYLNYNFICNINKIDELIDLNNIPVYHEFKAYNKLVTGEIKFSKKIFESFSKNNKSMIPEIGLGYIAIFDNEFSHAKQLFNISNKKVQELRFENYSSYFSEDLFNYYINFLKKLSYLGTSWIYFENNEYNESIKYSDYALLIDSKFLPSILTKINSLNELKKFGDSQIIINKALLDFPNNNHILLLKARNDLIYHNYEDSEKIFYKLYKNKFIKNYYEELGIYFYFNKELSKSKYLLEKAFFNKPSLNYHSYNYLAKLYLESNEFEKAKIELNESISVYPFNKESENMLYNLVN